MIRWFSAITGSLVSGVGCGVARVWPVFGVLLMGRLFVGVVGAVLVVLTLVCRKGLLDEIRGLVPPFGH